MNNEFIFEYDERIFEKYIRKGASSRIKRSVSPIKILIRSKKGKLFYRTYYVGSEKFKKYSTISKYELRNRVKMPRYLTYYNETSSRLKQFKLRGWQRKYLGDTFTSQIVHFSGFAYDQQNSIMKRGISSSFIDIVSNSFDKKTGTHTVKFKDGTYLKSKMLIKNDGSISIKTTGTRKIKTVKGNYQIIPINAELKGKIKIEKFPDNTYRRVLEISSIKGYTQDALLNFITNAQNKFAQIRVHVKNQNRLNVISKFLLSGFGTNVKIDSGFKNLVINSLKKSGITDKKVYDKILSSKNVAQVVNILVKLGIVSETSPIFKDISKWIKKNTDGNLVFESIDVINGIQNTTSQNTLHSVELQRSADNDYHKGFLRAQKPKKKFTVKI